MNSKTPESHTTETYLGDGLYASFDGQQIQLRAPREAGHDCQCFMEREVWNAFLEFMKAHDLGKEMWK